MRSQEEKTTQRPLGTEVGEQPGDSWGLQQNLTVRSKVLSLKVPPQTLTTTPRLSPILTLEFSQASLQRHKFIREFSCPFFNHLSNGFPNPELLAWVSGKITDISALLTFLSILMTITKVGEGMIIPCQQTENQGPKTLCKLPKAEAGLATISRLNTHGPSV